MKLSCAKLIQKIPQQFSSLDSCADVCFLSDNIYDYFNVSQGKVTVPNMDDGEEFQLADVSFRRNNEKQKHKTETQKIQNQHRASQLV